MKPDEIGPEQFLAELREIQKKIAVSADGTRMSDKLDAELILSELSALRKKIPFPVDGTARPSEDCRFRAEDLPIDTEDDFEWAVVLEALDSFSEDFSAGIERERTALEKVRK